MKVLSAAVNVLHVWNKQENTTTPRNRYYYCPYFTEGEKLSDRKIKSFLPGHIARPWKNQVINVSSLIPDFAFLLTMLGRPELSNIRQPWTVEKARGYNRKMK